MVLKSILAFLCAFVVEAKMLLRQGLLLLLQSKSGSEKIKVMLFLVKSQYICSVNFNSVNSLLL
jgi:hypothetical protein